MFDLTIEMAEAILAIEPGHKDRMISLGVSPDIADPTDGRHQWGIAKVRPEGDYHFIPDPEDGKEAFISFACQGSNVVDLIAWHPAAPSKWRWRIGETPVLNVDAINRRWPNEGPLQVHRNPLDHLRAGAEGLVVLDWAANSDIRRLALVDAIAGPADVINRIDRILRTPVRMPRLLRSEPPRAAA
ncbi:MAG: hypothetical protein AB7V46_18540 [Thermomicrobiales bacterium]